MNENESGEKFVPGEVKSESEKSPDLNPERKSKEEIEAEKEAMGKVVDIIKSSFLIHITTPEKAQKISSHGLLYYNLVKKAKKMGISKDIDFNVTYKGLLADNADKVYFYDSKHSEHGVVKQTEEYLRRWLNDWDDRERSKQRKEFSPMIIFLVNPDKIKLSQDEHSLGETPAVYTKKRIKTKQIMGIYISDHSARFENAVMQAQEIAKKLKVPIYKDGANLYWPKKMTNEEIKKMLGEKEKREFNKDSGQARMTE